MIIGISGMIAAGKSSLSEKLHKHYKDSYMLHEFDENDEVFNTFLKWLYEKKPNLTIGFQSYIVENHSAKFIEMLKKFEYEGQNISKKHIFLDRFSVEHYVFAKLILKEKEPRYLEAYDALFEKLITRSELPDLAIFLDINFDSFKKRIFERGRKSEIDNWNENYEYFKKLHENYLEIFKEISNKFDLNYVIIDTNNLSEEQVLAKAVEIIEEESLKYENRSTNR
ncbi:deoxynucleoside kinase [Mycoplasma phocoeninasale]|uniref:Deoxynucleoside kinase n=1 Tax=Mycoplasma phocoeninasale TaxID=2726117 RepID=A0A858U0N6_9MOLU|nr:deoxynucleoside kinase [Mycoplasma phocoeninasale]MBN0970776.1 deoxynucleoside kinase [Mycoplasma phocoeninasale]QJG66634.1 deoxynucleoside kinase [Mycoplasma phocoeninasale]